MLGVTILGTAPRGRDGATSGHDLPTSFVGLPKVPGVPGRCPRVLVCDDNREPRDLGATYVKGVKFAPVHDWGNESDAAARLAYDLLAEATGFPMARAHWRGFLEEVVANMPDSGWELLSIDVVDWALNRERDP